MTLTSPSPSVVDLPIGSLATGLRIGGEVLPGSAPPIEVVNPATGEVFATVAGADAADMDRAVRNADEVFRSGVWSRMAIHDRAQLMHAFADGIQARMEDLYKIETMNNGRPGALSAAETKMPCSGATSPRLARKVAICGLVGSVMS